MALSTYIVTVVTYNDLIALLGGGAVCTVVVKFRFHELYYRFWTFMRHFLGQFSFPTMYSVTEIMQIRLLDLTSAHPLRRYL
jgi:hypothetical protein